MKNTIPLVLAASFFCLVGCSGPKDNTAKTNTSDAGTVAPAGNSVPGATQPWSQSSQTGSSGATAGLNPAHGEPGHRCDIQVGAPLNSAPTAPVVTSGAAPAAMPPAPVLPSGPPVSTAKGLNPPHGQPGHDCGVAVGAPLKN